MTQQHPEKKPIASLMLKVIASHFAMIDTALELGEEEASTNVQEDLYSMAKWLEDNPELDEQLGSQANNFIREAEKANDLGIDFYATMSADEPLEEQET